MGPHGFGHDLRFAFRQLRKNPGFASIAILTLALGMCASIAIFAFVDGALVKPLPYLHPSGLVGVFERVEIFPQSNLSYADYLDWKRLNTVFTSLAAYQGSGMTLSTPNGAERAPAARVSDDFFKTLGVAPMLGRDFRPGEDLPTAPRTVILSYGAWHTRYAARPDVLGQIVTLNDAPHVIVGVLPSDFHFVPAEPADFWTTLHASNSCDLRRSCHNMYGVARLRDGVSVQTAAAQMSAIASQLEAQYPDSNRGQGASIVPLGDVIVGAIRPVLIVLIAGAALLLVLAIVNVGSLVLVRSEGRRRETAVRSALGASLGRVMRQFVTESMVLVGAASALGLVAAYWIVQGLTALIPANILARMPFLSGLGLNGRVLGFAGVIALVAVALLTSIPMLRVSSSLRDGLAEGSRGLSGATWQRLASKLVIVEIAAAMVLLAGAGLLGKSLYRLLHVDIGIQANHLATITVNASNITYATDEQTVALMRRIAGRLEALPGVESVGISSRRPLVGGNTMWIKVDGRPFHGEHNEVHYREVSASYFSVLGARLLRGRFFQEDDDASKPPVAIINQAFARQYFPGEDPLHRRLSYASSTPQPLMEIVGIVADVKEGPLDSATPSTIYVPFAQDPTSGFAVFVRTSQPEESILPTLSRAIHDLDPGLSTFAASAMRTLIDDSQSAYVRRSSASLVSGFAGLAWLLGVVGLYGIVAYSVSHRTREIGVRIALGAQRPAIYRLILREAGWLTAVGILLGLACAVASATLMRSLLFGVSAWDAPTLLAVAGVLAISTLVASYVPARRAASVNPVEALRAE